VEYIINGGRIMREVLDSGEILLKDSKGNEARIKFIRSKTLIRMEWEKKWIQIMMKNGEPFLYSDFEPGRNLKKK
jgi:hypothetical protein